MRTAISVLGLVADCDQPFSTPAIRIIIGRMDKGGYGVHSLTTTELGHRKLYSIRFFKQGEEDIHVTGFSDIQQLYEAALAEAHRRYCSARVQTPVHTGAGLGRE